MSEEWGPWIEHDGKGCPVPEGTVAQAMRRNGKTEQGKVASGDHGPRSAWVWGVRGNSRMGEVIRYRVRKPRGLAILESLVASLDAPEGPIRAPVQSPEKVTQ